MNVVTRTQKGERQILCFSRKTGCFWRPLRTEELMHFTSACRFPSLDGARQGAAMHGGAAESMPDIGELPAFLAPQAG
jgi:hypothetical protein